MIGECVALGVAGGALGASHGRLSGAGDMPHAPFTDVRTSHAACQSFECEVIRDHRAQTVRLPTLCNSGQD
jgi:hypothetical protein